MKFLAVIAVVFCFYSCGEPQLIKKTPCNDCVCSECDNCDLDGNCECKVCECKAQEKKSDNSNKKDGPNDDPEACTGDTC